MPQDTILTYKSVTEKYYSAWLGVDDLAKVKGIEYVYSPERNVRQMGYSGKFDIYIWRQPDSVIVSYGDAAAHLIPALRRKLDTSYTASDMMGLLQAEFSLSPKHSIKYCFQRIEHSPITALALDLSQYADYAAFFMTVNPVRNIDWLPEYFEEMVRCHYCVGAYEDGRLVSCTDAPSMPYMAGQVQEIGIRTHPEYQGKGYAAAACIACAKSILASGKVPQWSTGIDNIASQRTAQRAGFAKLADVLAVSMA